MSVPKKNWHIPVMSSEAMKFLGKPCWQGSLEYVGRLHCESSISSQ